MCIKWEFYCCLLFQMNYIKKNEKARWRDENVYERWIDTHFTQSQNVKLFSCLNLGFCCTLIAFFFFSRFILRISQPSHSLLFTFATISERIRLFLASNVIHNDSCAKSNIEVCITLLTFLSFHRFVTDFMCLIPIILLAFFLYFQPLLHSFTTPFTVRIRKIFRAESNRICSTNIAIEPANSC